MLRLILGAASGALAAWLYRSERAREDLRQRASQAPESVRRAAQAAASAAASRVERAAGAVAEAPLPGPLKGAASRAAAAARRVGAPVGVGAATLYLQALPDGSWVGDVAWGGWTLREGGPEPEAVTRRLASHLAGVPEAGRPARIKLVRVSRNGEREEREEELVRLLA